MEIPAGIIQNGIDAFLLVFIRMTGLFVISPIFGRKNIPVIFKIGFSLLLAMILINTISVSGLYYYSNIYTYVALVFKEFIVGMIIGFVSYLIFTAVYIAGQIIDMQVGFGMINVLDPVSNIQAPITSNFYFIMSMLVFLILNGHHTLIKALFDSYKILPLGSATFDNRIITDIFKIFSNLFTIGFKISAPVIATVLITDIALGVISKTIPQLNVFIVGMPLKIALGVLVMILTIPVFISVLDVLINGMNSDIFSILKDLMPG